MSCSIGTTFCKADSEVLDYVVDWATWLGADTISTSAFAVTSGITVDSDANDTTSATVWLSGGTGGTQYTVTNTITTAASRTAERSFYIQLVAAR